MSERSTDWMDTAIWLVIAVLAGYALNLVLSLG